MRFIALAAVALGTVRCETGTCTDLSPDVASLCVPDTLMPDQTAVIEVRETCGICSSPPQCNATLTSGAVVVELHSQFCTDVQLNCNLNSPCLQQIARCTLPALGEGDYPLILPGNQTRLLHVRAGGQRNCQLPGS
jgi:hypothetical protein